MQGFGANMEISFMKYGSFMQKFAPFETFVKITYVKKLKKPSENSKYTPGKRVHPNHENGKFHLFVNRVCPIHENCNFHLFVNRVHPKHGNSKFNLFCK